MLLQGLSVLREQSNEFIHRERWPVFACLGFIIEVDNRFFCETSLWL
jgi:hypothetical protein